MLFRLIAEALGLGSERTKNPLFDYTSGHWLVNNDAQAAARRVEFNVAALHLVAAKAVGATSVTSMKKIGESRNRVFLLALDDGQNVIARIPTSLAGPPHYATASEVATMDLLRRIGMPVPKVLAWSSRADATDHGVAAEFIIMENCAGTPLVEVRDDLDPADLLDAVVKLHQPLLDLCFTNYGSIYYPNDVQESSRMPASLNNPPTYFDVDLGDFCIGPICTYDAWKAERAAMDVDRGPWSSALNYMLAGPKREQAWIDIHGTPHMHDSHLVGLTGQGKQDDHMETLEEYKKLVHYLVPEDPSYLDGHLWHPDLHADNIFILKKPFDAPSDAPAFTISSVIDWEGALVAPAFLQLKAPLIFWADVDIPVGNDPVPPIDLTEFDEPERSQAEEKYIAKLYHKSFDTGALGKVGLLHARETIILLDSLARSTWQFGSLPLRTALFQFCNEHFEDVAPDYACPLEFPPEKLESLANEHGYWSEKCRIAKAMDDEFDVGEFGFVEGDDAKFREVQRAVEKRRKEWMAQGEADGTLAEIQGHIWPYRNTLDDMPRKHFILDFSDTDSI